jgi:hypothetical protein
LAASNGFYLYNIKEQKIIKADGLTTARVVAADQGGNMAVCASGKGLYLFPLPAFRQSVVLSTPAEILSMAVHGASRRIYTGSRDGFIRIYSYSGETLGQYKAEGAVVAMTLSSDGLIFAAGQQTYLGDIALENVRGLSRHSAPVRSVSITPDGHFAVSGGDDAFVSWDLQTNHSELTKIMNVSAAGVDPYFRYIVAGTEDGDSGRLIIQYTSDRGERREIYAFRDATLTISPVGYADGTGMFGKYLSYNDKGRNYSFQEASPVVHKPEKLIYPLRVPKVAQAEGLSQNPQAYIDSAPPMITLFERGFALADRAQTVTISGSIADESGVAWARADYKPLSLTAEGHFSIETAVPPEGKTVVISAADNHGNAADRAVYLQGKTESEGTGRKVALFIGINQYENLPGLATAELGARTMAELFKAYGYEPILLLGKEATREAVFTEINRLRRELSAGDKLIIHYAGHGSLDTATGAAYWQPYDAGAEDDTRWVDTAQIVRNLSASGCDFMLVVDSCFAGATSREYFKNQTALVLSGGVEPVSDIGSGGYSLFTGAVIRAMRQAQFTDSKGFFDAILKEVPKDAVQTPEYFSPNGFSF